MADAEDEGVREVSNFFSIRCMLFITRCNTISEHVTNKPQNQRLKEALWFTIGKMVDEESIRRNRNVTPQFIGALTAMVWQQIGT
jgi:hypothetical protein